ncbi:MAG: hypothetical protein ACREX3_19075, partial [Gammaproteobacteria bacterium]
MRKFDQYLVPGRCKRTGWSWSVVLCYHRQAISAMLMTGSHGPLGLVKTHSSGQWRPEGPEGPFDRKLPLAIPEGFGPGCGARLWT